MSNLSKAISLLFVSFISFIFTEYSRPFLLKEMNILELYSNISASIVLFSGVLYLIGVNEYYGVFCFIIILITNLTFLLLWFESLMEIIIKIYFENLMRLCPKYLMKLLVLLKAFKFANSSWNLLEYFSNLVKTYKEIIQKKGKIDFMDDIWKNNMVIKSRFNIPKPFKIGLSKKFFGKEKKMFS